MDAWNLVTSAEMRERDRFTVETLGVPAEVLMECAGLELARRAARLRPGRGTIAVFVGPGNNGGDGWVAARHLHHWGLPVVVVAVSDPPLGEDSPAAANRRRARRVGVREETLATCPPATVFVDALLGTGVNRPLEGAIADAVGWLNRRSQEAVVLAADLPTGVDADTGAVRSEAVRADETLAFGAPKIGLTWPPGRDHCGRISVAGIGIPREISSLPPAARMLTARGAADRVPDRMAASHKGTFGHVLVVAGSPGMSGAAALAADGALRVGAGRITVGCPEPIHAVLEMKCTEAMTVGLPATDLGGFSRDSLPELRKLAEARDVLVVGPGIARATDAGDVVRAILREIARPVVVDADALYAVAAAPDLCQGRESPTVITPHPGEAAHLLGIDAAEVNRDRRAAAEELATRFGATAVLKGAGTVIADPAGEVWINPTGGPALATGGTGDVLAGAVGGLLAQGCDAVTAAALAAYLHGLAADRMATAVGLRAGDLADALPEALAYVRGVSGQATEMIEDPHVLAFP